MNKTEQLSLLLRLRQIAQKMVDDLTLQINKIQK